MATGLKNVLVTGGGTGMGQAAAWAFQAAGYQLIVAGRRADKLQETVERARTGQPIRSYVVDVANRDAVQQLVAWTMETCGPIDILIHAAGINIKNRSMLDMPPEEWDRVLAVNATGAYNCLWAVLPGMRARQSGLILNITSIAGKRASDLGGIAYCASKFAATGLGTAAGLEEARRGIRITNVYPGEVDTPLLEQRPQPVSEAHRATMLRPADVAQLLLAVAQLPDYAHVPELVIKPVSQAYA